MKIIKKTYAEYWGYYWRVTHRHTIPGILQWDIDLINLVEKKCHLHPGMKILDLGCAGGDQAKVFAKRGYRVTGIDSTPNLIEFARSSFQKEGLSAEFIAADMLSIEYKNEFDLCVIFSGTFGFFSDKKNFELLQRIYTALKTKGQVFISYLSLEEMVQMKNEKKWNQIENGFELTRQWFDIPSSTYRTSIRQVMLDGTIIEPAEEDGYHANEIIRCYGTREMENLVERAGFEVKHHFTSNHIGKPDYVIKNSDYRDMIVLVKPE